MTRTHLTEDEKARFRLLKVRAVWECSDYLRDMSYVMVRRIMRADGLMNADDVRQVRAAMYEVMGHVGPLQVCELIEAREAGDHWAKCVNLERLATELECTKYELRNWEVRIEEVV